jgi:2-dehydro-3-deoxyphosphooctonate aldolase (KDO 8-P synthase)
MPGIDIADFTMGNDRPIVIIGGVNVLESRDLAMTVAEHMKGVAARLGVPYVFKGSYDKANRSSHESYRGPGLDDGLRILEDVRRTHDVPVITDIHAPDEAAPVAEVCDILQIPAFLARQTDLVGAAAATGKPINVKKPQFTSPSQAMHIVRKVRAFGNDKVMLCERGSCFGYDNLVVDMLGLSALRKDPMDVPVVFDVTHSLQIRDPGAKASGGRREQVFDLARAGVATGVASIFVEAHPDPDKALCDGPSALPLDRFEDFVRQVMDVDAVAKRYL